MAARPTVDDVARAAGVSRTTVSHALNDKGRVDARTRELVRAVASDLGYVPSRAARSLALGRSDMIGLLLPHLGSLPLDELLLSDWYGKVTATASHEALRQGRALTVLPSLESPAALAAYGMDGLILLNPTADDPRSRLVAAAGTRVVLLGKDPAGTLGPCVVPATSRGMRDLLDHLWANGARSIGLIKTDIDWSEGSAAVSAFRGWCRSRGARSQVATAGVATATSREQTTAVAERVAFQVLSGKDRPDALIGLLEDFGRGILTAAKALDLRVPEDLLVAQDTDGIVAQMSDPPLTALDLDLPAQMAEAMRLLVAEQPADPSVVITVPVTLHQRASTLRE